MHEPPTVKARPADTSRRQFRHEGPLEPFVRDAPALEVAFEANQIESLNHALRHPPTASKNFPQTTRPPRGSCSGIQRTPTAMESHVARVYVLRVRLARAVR